MPIKKIHKKITIIFVLGVFLLVNFFSPFFYFPAKAATPDFLTKCTSGALSGIVTDLLGSSLPDFGSITKVPVTDQRAQMATLQIKFEDCIKAATESALKLALQNLKKKLLDQIVDQTLEWIRDDKQPKYVRNFNQFMKESLNESSDNLIREIASTKILPGLSDSLIAAVKSRRNTKDFKDSLTYTLDQTTNPEEFQKDFSKGGWQALMKSLEPQNNADGVILMTMLQAQKNEQENLIKKTSTMDGQAQSEKECTIWVLVKKDGNQEYIYKNVGSGSGGENGAGQAISPEKIRIQTDPTQTPPTPPSNHPDAKFICDPRGEQIKTPASIVNAVANKIVTKDIDQIIEADDLESYINKIGDAVLSRLYNEGLDLFNRGVGRGEGDPLSFLGNNGEEFLLSTQNNLEELIGIREGTTAQSQINNQIKNSLTLKSKNLYDSASSSRHQVDVQIKNINDMNIVLTTTTNPIGLLLCMSYKPGFSPNFTPPSPSILANNDFYRNILQALPEKLKNEVNPFKNDFENYIQKASEYQTKAGNINSNTSGNIISQLQRDIALLEENLSEKNTSFGETKNKIEHISREINQNRTSCITLH